MMHTSYVSKPGNVYSHESQPLGTSSCWRSHFPGICALWSETLRLPVTSGDHPAQILGQIAHGCEAQVLITSKTGPSLLQCLSTLSVISTSASYPATEGSVKALWRLCLPLFFFFFFSLSLQVFACTAKSPWKFPVSRRAMYKLNYPICLIIMNF